MTDSNTELKTLLGSLKVSWWEKILLPAVVLFWFFFERYVEPDQAPFAATLSLFVVIGYIIDKQQKVARALEILESNRSADA